MSEERKDLEEVGDWEIFESAQCLLFVCLISVVHHKLKKDSIVQTPRKGHVSGAAEGQFVAWPRCGAPQERPLSRSPNADLCFLLARITDYAAACTLYVLMSAFPHSLSTLTPIRIRNFCWNLLIACQHLPWFSSSQCRIYPSLSRYTLSSGNASLLSHTASLWCFLCLCTSWTLNQTHKIRQIQRQDVAFLPAFKSTKAHFQHITCMLAWYKRPHYGALNVSSWFLCSGLRKVYWL